jgi:hypothetical protein
MLQIELQIVSVIASILEREKIESPSHVGPLALQIQQRMHAIMPLIQEELAHLQKLEIFSGASTTEPAPAPEPVEPEPTAPEPADPGDIFGLAKE